MRLRLEEAAGGFLEAAETEPVRDPVFNQLRRLQRVLCTLTTGRPEILRLAAVVKNSFTTRFSQLAFILP
jgi:hypothetical protein